jgi:predicted nucleotidyltransferase
MNIDIAPALDILKASVEGLIAVYVFGSFAKGEERPDSDIDIAIIAWPPISSMKRYELIGDLSVVLGRAVDLVDLNDQRVSIFLKLEVLKAGPPILVLKQYEMHVKEMAIMRMAQDQYERLAPYLADIRERGTVYGA